MVMEAGFTHRRSGQIHRWGRSRGTRRGADRTGRTCAGTNWIEILWSGAAWRRHRHLHRLVQQLQSIGGLLQTSGRLIFQQGRQPALHLRIKGIQGPTGQGLVIELGRLTTGVKQQRRHTEGVEIGRWCDPSKTGSLGGREIGPPPLRQAGLASLGWLMGGFRAGAQQGEVDQERSSVAVGKDQVGGVNVAMHQTSGMHFLQHLQHLTEQSGKPLFAPQQIERTLQGWTSDVLLDKAEHPPLGIGIQYPGNAGMAQPIEASGLHP